MIWGLSEIIKSKFKYINITSVERQVINFKVISFLILLSGAEGFLSF